MSTPKSKYKIRKQDRAAGQPMKARSIMPWWFELAHGPYYSMAPQRREEPKP